MDERFAALSIVGFQGILARTEQFPTYRATRFLPFPSCDHGTECMRRYAATGAARANASLDESSASIVRSRVQLHPLKPARAKRRQAVVVLESPKGALDSGATTVVGQRHTS